MKPVTLRHHVESSDRDAIKAITGSSGFFSDSEVDLALEVFDEAIGQNRSGYQYIVALTDDRIIAYACWGKDAQTHSSFELYWIAVDDRARSKGIGGLLLNEVEESIRHSGGGRLFAETSGRKQYQPTQMFYKAHGYHEVACIDDYFGPGDARVIYAKQL